ncbi:cyclic-AMP response element binding protein B isoform X5 [Leptinotarsa decemlineata]|uniref:cyclic-AMP response element binding protein B isoform X5 n=1 Tax=Leptinotarsa decemlineata TaxID=7539 RepID=UPI000C253B6C|nr:cyclic AMP-responsive element-binding protein 1 isoform X5 [Leptinotarsa decemlineata]
METIVEEKCQVDPLAPSPDPQGGIASVGVNNSQPHLVTATNIVQLTLPSHTQAQVQSVIQPNQQSVIQTAANLQPMLSKGNVILVSSKPNSVIHTTQGSLQTLRVVEAGSDDSFSEEESPKKRRDLLTRRPSYRKILNDLGGVLPATALQITSGDGGQGIQTLTMTNATAGGAIVQYAQGQEFFVPGKDVSLFIDSYPEVKSESPENSEFPVRFKSSPGSPDSYSYSPVVAQSGNISGGGGEDQARKREMRLLKNREAARECRRKKKEYIKCLENRVAVLENQNQTLIEELKSLKELYCQQKTE